MTGNDRMRVKGYFGLSVKRHQCFGMKVPVLYSVTGVTSFTKEGASLR